MSQTVETTKDQAARIDAIWERCNKEKPAKEDVQAFRQELAAHPELWQIYGNLIHVSFNGLWSSVKHQGIADSMRAGWDVLKRDLAWESAPPLDRLLIEHVILCWARLALMEHRYSAAVILEGQATWHYEYWDRRLEAAQRRYQRACITLARVRRLGRPGPIQVNIGRQQVNQVMTGA